MPIDFPNVATAARTVLSLASSGNVTIEPLRVFTLEEFRDIVDTIPR